MFLGGAALEGPRISGGISSPRASERIEEAKEEWKTGQLRAGPGRDKEFIPLPEN